MDPRQKEKVVLFGNQFMWLQDENSGQIKVYVGPGVVDPATHERPVLYNPRKDAYYSPNRHSEAVQPFTVVPQGHYCILHNPRQDGEHPFPLETGIRVTQRIHLPSGRTDDSIR